VYHELTKRLREALAAHIREKYGVELGVALERPPKIEMGEVASPVCFELAKRLKKAPRMIAQEIAGSLGKVAGIEKVEVAGGGYLNAYFERAEFWKEVASGPSLRLRVNGWPASAEAATAGKRVASGERKKEKGFIAEGRRDAEDAEEREKEERGGGGRGKIIVEHTSINPNKAAHVGHVRNAVLGDTMARVLRHAGHAVQVQNYIDNTGVQVADVVIALLRMEKRSPVNVKMMAMEPKFDYLCWDLYAKATQFFAEDKERAAKLRGETLKAIEGDRGEESEVAQVVADAIVGCHLRTMARLGIGYDLLARESEILHLKFWDTAFEKLKTSGAIQLATTGKMAGCWILPWEEKPRINTEGTESAEDAEKSKAEKEEENIQDKIIVRSNGTVTYVGKDIAYQLWKFGLLGKDFHYRKWPDAPAVESAVTGNGKGSDVVWATTTFRNDPAAPHFGEAAETVYNVIDSRQAYLQDVVAEGLRRLGHAGEAERSIHFAYEIVALTPRCAEEMGYELTPEEAKKPYVEVSGRKGFGVKADDLIDKLEAATLSEVVQRHPEMAEAEQRATAHAIAVGTLRFFLLKYTRNAIIAFDFKDALSFEGETGPYCQNAVVRIRGIRRKTAEIATAAVTDATVRELLNGADGNSFWDLLRLAGALDSAVESAIGAQEPAFVAKHAFQLAQTFNNFYHKHHILSEADEQKRAFLLALTEIVETQLVRALGLLGIQAPEKM
jgi:arginyl-tRNA synthetase